ncbi:hypothetical protein KIN20_008901 [Parelaphostrongylus tenuis]|uniref:Uncharacterized protein n=1 Tax=Parelaphostrongylus tenuis TaxID=148309 RepID=A0AAD5MX56_PARTN|nr:hypothetical protein KIN20_008901 [Parelaphostrongylus tenuis]
MESYIVLNIIDRCYCDKPPPKFLLSVYTISNMKLFQTILLKQQDWKFKLSELNYDNVLDNDRVNGDRRFHERHRERPPTEAT